MTNEINIRKAGPGDAGALIEFNQAMAFETEGKRLAEDKIGAGVRAVFDDSTKGFYVVAEAAGQVLGGLMVTYEWSDWRNAWFWWIQSVYIRPEGRGQKLYSAMYQFVKDQAARAGNVCGFRLYVETENVHAQAVYQALGMQQPHYLMYERGDMTRITESEFARIVEGIAADRDVIVKHNPVGKTDEETLLWMLLSCLVSFLSIDDSQAPCFKGRPDVETYRNAIRYVLADRRESGFDADHYLDRLAVK